ncbi:MAG: hypothetical protein HZB30_08200 [Nitrospirae bacterium]|nr:hypothetical protein [Nitrospirota bacterium]
MNFEHMTLVAQKISFAFEDQYFDERKRNIFIALFNKYLLSVDTAGTMEPYDALVLLGRKDPSEFDLMVKEMKEKELISD